MLEFLPELFNTLRDEEYCMTEAEAAIFLPCLAEKVRNISPISCGVGLGLFIIIPVYLSLLEKDWCFSVFIFNSLSLVQLGHNIEKVREKMRELMKQLIQAYSVAKTYPYILEGLRSKNNRTRIECTDLIGYLLETCGTEVVARLDKLSDIPVLFEF